GGGSDGAGGRGRGVAGRLPVAGGTTLTRTGTGSSVMMAGPRRHSDRVAVVGGGIGGLAAAAFLRRAGLAATVYEQASALGEVGAGLVVAPNAARLLRRLPAGAGLAHGGVRPGARRGCSGRGARA